MDKILCPFHIEDTPSCVLYEDTYHCFGCGAHGKIVDIPDDIVPKNRMVKTRFKTDLHSDLKNIKNLPIKEIRGLKLHCDDEFYYIIWPNNDYYKKRKIHAKDADKYRCPSGYSKPILEFGGSFKDLLIVEGELNAYSVQLSKPDFVVCSPGPCTDFLRYMNFYLQWDNIYLAFDSDPAGISQAVKLRDALLEHKKRVFLHPMKTDFNDILTKEGLNEVCREVEKIRGL
jgi:hypothetical protein